MAVDPRVFELVLRFHALQKEGQPCAPEELCRDCPELLSELRRWLKDHSERQDDPTGTDRRTQTEQTRSDDGPASSPGPPAGAPACGGRYRLAGEIGRGGMGAVLHAHDDRLNRELAVKVLHPRFHDDATMAHRFTDEARIGGRLQHPGVVPVYDLGTLPDGRPFFAMKLVEGRTLANLLRERPDPTHDLPRFLKIFEQVCQTVAYAHSRSVIHRDLKPANVMVGAFGEVQVMDWGIAKVLGGWPGADPHKPDAPAREPGVALAGASGLYGSPAGQKTEAGAVLGTYAYMSPEQARGQTDQVDERCDVFGLGAILCEILTGRPPYWHERSGVVGQLAQAADLGPAHDRLQACGADPDLLALARACLEPEPQRRPRDAGVVAAAVTAFLIGVQERLHQAEVERAGAEVRVREERKRRRMTLVLAAVVLAAVLIGVGAGTAVYRQRLAQQGQTALLVNQALGQALALRDQARGAPVADPGQRQRAAALWRDTLAAGERAEEALSGGRADAATAGRVETLLAELRETAAEADRDRRMLQRLEEARDRAAELQESDYVRPRRVHEFIFGAAGAPAYAAAFREYGIDVEKLSIAEAAGRIRRRDIREDLAAAIDAWYFLEPAAAGGRLLEVSRAADLDPLRDRVREAVARKDRPALASLATADVSDLPVPMTILLADVLYQQGLKAEALKLLKRARLRHPDDTWINDVLGLHYNFGDPPDYTEASRCYAAAVALRPDKPVLWANLGSVLALEGRLDEAITALRQALHIKPDFTTAQVSLCHCLAEKEGPAAALPAVREALARRPDSPMLLTMLGSIQHAQGLSGDAALTYTGVLARHPEWVEARVGLAYALAETDWPALALGHLDLAQRRHPEFPAIYEARGTILYRQGDLNGALAALRRSLRLNPGQPAVWSGLGRLLSDQGRHDEALGAQEKALGMAPRNPLLLVSRAGSYRLAGRPAEAAAQCRAALRLNPKLVAAHSELALALTAQGKDAEAADAYRRLLDLGPDDPWTRCNLGDCLRRLKDYAGAADAYRAASRARPNVASFHDRLGHVCYDQGRCSEAVPHFREAVRLKPGSAAFRQHLGNALRRDGHYPDAVDVLREAVRLAPKDVEVQADLAVALRQAGRLDEAVQVGREAVRLHPASARARHVLALGLQKQGKREEALAEMVEALRLDPKDR